jgi:hypothetical protein
MSRKSRYTALRRRVRRLRQSRCVFRLIAIALLALSAISLGLVLTDHYFFQGDMPSRFPDSHGAVAFGVEKSAALAGYKAANRPYFNFCPVGNDEWKIRFNWQVDASPDPQGFLKTAPAVVLSVPTDASQITPEKRVLANLSSGEIKRTGRAVTSVSEDRKSPDELLLRLRPTLLSDPTDGPQTGNVAYYGVYFHTHSLNRGRNGLARTWFKISRGSRPASTQPVDPDFLPKYNVPGDLAFIFCSSDDGREGGVDIDSLYPVPDEKLERGKLVWGSFDSSRFSVSGTVKAGMMATVTDQAGWLAANSFAAAIGTMYGAGLESAPTLGSNDPSSSLLNPSAPPVRKGQGGAPSQQPRNPGNTADTDKRNSKSTRSKRKRARSR